MGTRRDLAWSLIEDTTAVLAVVAHPDDESFGLGAILSWFTQRDVPTAVLCFTRGEQSTLRSDTEPLDDTRSTEFIAAARALNVGHTIQLDHPDGTLATVPVPTLTASIHQLAAEVDADLLLVFDQGGITGHPDHQAATSAALALEPALPVLSWAIAARVAETLNTELGTAFSGRDPAEIDLRLTVDRRAQRHAIACHHSQSLGNQVLARRLELQGDTECLRLLSPT